MSSHLRIPIIAPAARVSTDRIRMNGRRRAPITPRSGRTNNYHTIPCPLGRFCFEAIMLQDIIVQCLPQGLPCMG